MGKTFWIGIVAGGVVQALVGVLATQFFAAAIADPLRRDIAVIATWILLLVIGGSLLVAWVWKRRPESARPAPSFRIRLASPPEGCDEHYLDCVRLIITNDGPVAVRATVGVRIHGTGDSVHLLWEPHRQREALIASGQSATAGLLIRCREAGHYWDVHQQHGQKVSLGLGVCYLLDETFLVAANPAKVLNTGRTYIGVDVALENGGTLTQHFEIHVPSDYRKALYVVPETAAPVVQRTVAS